MTEYIKHTGRDSTNKAVSIVEQILTNGGITLGTLLSGEDQTNNVMVTEQGQFGYETVAVSQTAQVLGATGATGDFLHRLIINVITVASADVTLLDNATSIVINTGGADLLEGVYSIEFNMASQSGAWKITTGAGATVIGVGRFT